MKKAKKKVFVGVAVFITIIVVLCLLFGYFCVQTSVPKGKYNFSISNTGLMVLESDFVFDSGSSISVLYDKQSKAFPVFLTWISDYHKKMIIKSIYYAGRNVSENYPVNHFLCVIDSGFYRPDKSLLGILGMNVIQRANWHFSFRDSILEVLPTSMSTTIPEDALCWSYKNRMHPQVSMTINGVKMKRVLVDMGSTMDFCLIKSNLSKCHKKGHFQTSITNVDGLLGSESLNMCTFDYLWVDTGLYQNVSINEGKRNLVGMKFLSRFDHLFWDSRHKKVYLWNDEEK